MKKKILRVLFSAGSLFLFCAFDWPPEPYNMPRTVLTSELTGSYLGGLFNSIRAIGNMGFILTMILVSVYIIPVFVRKVFLKDFLEQQAIRKAVGKNEFARSVRAADRAKNREAIIDDRVAEMEINSDARKKFRELHPDADLEERLYQRQLSYSAELRFTEENPGADVERALYRREVAFNADEEYRFKHPGRDVEQAIDRMEVRSKATQEYRRRHGLR